MGYSPPKKSISLLPTLFAAVLFGPLEAGIVGAASMLGDPELIASRDPDRMPRLKWATYTSTRFMGGVAVGISAVKTLASSGSGFGGLIAATLVGGASWRNARRAFAPSLSKVRGRPCATPSRADTPLALLSAPVYAPVIAVLALPTRRSPPGHWRSSSSPHWRHSVCMGSIRSSDDSPSTFRSPMRRWRGQTCSLRAR